MGDVANPAIQETDFEASTAENGRDASAASPLLGHQNGYGTNGSSTNGVAGSRKAAGPAQPSPRALAPDLLRGLLVAVMALDHNVLALKSWSHSQADEMERDSFVMHSWNRTVGYLIRINTHLCAPGFTFLLGLGVVYFVRSRTALGWSTWKLVRHFAVRAFVLILLSEAMGMLMAPGVYWVVNIVLMQLALDYFLAGLLWLGIVWTEKSLTRLLLKIWPEDDAEEDDAREPLMRQQLEGGEYTPKKAASRAANISWHLHNAALVVLAIVTIWWNIWFSPTHGHCVSEQSDPVEGGTAGIMAMPKLLKLFFEFWIYAIQDPKYGVLSGFPPLAWISFCILGLLYGRIIIARKWSPKTLALGTASVGVAFLLLFVLTRLFRFGNLSEDCLKMPEHLAHPETNPYLASLPSFFFLIKYPPDVAFWAYTMGVNFFLLAGFGILPLHIALNLKPLLAYGRSALFFYATHMYALFAFGAVLTYFLGHEVPFKDPRPGQEDKQAIGVDQLWAWWLNWFLVLALLYPACVWYGKFKAKKGPDSIWRFF